MSQNVVVVVAVEAVKKHIQSSLCTKTNLGTQKQWPSLTSGCSSKWELKIVVIIDIWSLFESGR